LSSSSIRWSPDVRGQRLLGSLTESQREELSGLMSQTLEDAGLAAEMARLADALRPAAGHGYGGWPATR